jgi:hypothetical protein
MADSCPGEISPPSLKGKLALGLRRAGGRSTAHLRTFCNGRGQCIPAVGHRARAVCLCEPGWAGPGCEEREGAASPLELGGFTKSGESCAVGRDCSGHGACNNGTCWCDAGWAGRECDWKRCPFDCGGHGACDGHGRCACETGWVGFDCSSPDDGLLSYKGFGCATHCLDECQSRCGADQGCLATCVDSCVPACEDAATAEGDRKGMDLVESVGQHDGG